MYSVRVEFVTEMSRFTMLVFLSFLCLIATISTEEVNIGENLAPDTNTTKTSIRSSENYELARAGGGAGGKGGKKKDGGFMQKILPFMVIPFMISSSMIPMALVGLKFMLLKSAFIGKIAIILLLINMFTRFNNQGGVYSHNINLSPAQKDVAMGHYGYNGDEEYGAYVNKRRKRRKR